MFYLQYDCRCFDWHLQVCSNEQNEERHVIFSVRLQFSRSFFETCISFHLLHILFLQPLHSGHDLHPLQCTISHSPTYNLRASCFFSYFQSHLKVKCVARPPIQNEATSCMQSNEPQILFFVYSEACSVIFWLKTLYKWLRESSAHSINCRNCSEPFYIKPLTVSHTSAYNGLHTPT